LCPSLRISGHLPAPVVNGGGDRFWKWKEFKLWRARDLDLDLQSGHTAYRPAAVIDLYLYTKFHSNLRNFLWTDGRTDGQTDGRTDGRTDIFPLYTIRSTFGSRPNNMKIIFIFVLVLVTKIALQPCTDQLVSYSVHYQQHLTDVTSQSANICKP